MGQLTKSVLISYQKSHNFIKKADKIWSKSGKNAKKNFKYVENPILNLLKIT
jgi:hypothetical protein